VGLIDPEEDDVGVIDSVGKYVINESVPVRNELKFRDKSDRG